MTVDCADCSKCDLDPSWEAEACEGCGEWHFCEQCAAERRRYAPYRLFCQRCEVDYDDAMAEYDEDAEREAIGDREGGYDPYDNTNW